MIHESLGFNQGLVAGAERAAQGLGFPKLTWSSHRGVHQGI